MASTTVNFVAPFSFNGTLTSQVWKNDSSSPFGLNALTFTYELAIASGSANAVDRFTVSSFNGYQTDVSYTGGTPSAGVPPLTIGRSPTGDIMRFVFEDGLGNATLAPGKNSALLVVQTDASNYQPTIAAVIDGSSANVASFAPAVIPEPSPLLLAALAGGVLCVLRRSWQSRSRR